MALYCSSCGTGLSEDARFCSVCGTATGKMPQAMHYGAPASPLVRPRIGRQFAGVCQGMANAYHWDVLVVRLVVVIAGIVTFPLGEISYFVAWLIIPEEAAVSAPSSAPLTAPKSN